MPKNNQQTLTKILSKREEKRRDKVHEILGIQLLDAPFFLFFLLGDKKEEKGCLFLFHGRKRGGALGCEEFFTVKGSRHGDI